MGHQEDIVKPESKIIVIRDTQVILDRDVAELYGVETRDINKSAPPLPASTHSPSFANLLEQSTR